MRRCIRRFLSNLILLVMLFEFMPTYLGVNFNVAREAKAFFTQMDSIAPGYVVKSEGGGITFDLSPRLSDTMTVESFSVKNTDSEKAKNDLPEEMVGVNGAKWLSKDPMINGDTYEITSIIFDSDLQDNLKYINTFKYIDKNEYYNPDIKISQLDTRSISSNYLGSVFTPQDIIIDFSRCREIIDNGKDLKFDILNSDLSKKLGTINIDKNSIKNGYTVALKYIANIFENNKDYILRLYDGNVYWDKLFSLKVKSSPKIYQVYKPTESAIRYSQSEKTVYFDVTKMKINRDLWDTLKFSFVLSNDRLGFKPVERRGTVGYTSTSIKVPDEYYTNSSHPSTLKYLVVGPHDVIIAEYTFQITFLSDRKAHVWDGLDLYVNMNDGYKIEYIKPISNDSYSVPHSWDGFPKAHYITFYDNTLTKQIGGEFRFDVRQSKLDFLDKKHDVKGADFKIAYRDMKHGFNSYNFKVESSNTYKDWAYAYIPVSFYADIIEIKTLEVNIENFEVSTNGTSYDFTLTIKNHDVTTGNKMSIIDDNGKEYVAQANVNSKFVFSNIPIKQGGKYIVTFNNISGLVYFKNIDDIVIFNPPIVGSYVNGEKGLEITIDKKYDEILNPNSKKNSIKILDMEGKSTGNDFSDIGVCTKSFKLNKPLSPGTHYIAEFNNGNGGVFKTTFEYTPLDLQVEYTKGTSVKLKWDYPNNYLIMDGDILNIYFKKDGQDYSPIPDAKIMHGFQNIDFDDVRTYTSKDLTPNTLYHTKLELITNEGIKYLSEVDFFTSNFKIIDEKVEGVIDSSGSLLNKKVKIIWDTISEIGTEFSIEDRIEVFLKPRSHTAFPRDPEITVSRNLDRIKSVEVNVPNCYEPYDIQVAYNIGGVRHAGNIVGFIVEPKLSDVKISNVTDSTAQLEWNYPEGMKIEDDYEIRVYLKKKTDLDYKILKVMREANDGEVSKNKSFVLDELSCDTSYLVKLEYRVGNKFVAGINEEINQVTEYEFKTDAFKIQNIRVEQLEGKRIKLMWDISNKNYKYSFGDNIQVYMREKGVEYPDSPFFESEYDIIYDKIKDVNSCELTLSEYEKEYDFKIRYWLNNNQFLAYKSYSVQVGKIDFNMDSIDDKKANVSWGYPDKYEFSEGDTIKLELLEKESENQLNSKEVIIKTHGKEEDLRGFNKYIFDLQKDKEYIIKLFFTPLGIDTREYNFNFRATNTVQIFSLESSPVNATTVKLNWDIYPKDYKFNSKDKVEIFYNEIEGNGDNFIHVSPTIIQSKNLEKFKQAEIKNLSVNENYLFRVKYTINDYGDSISESYKDIKGKPEYGKFGSSIIDTYATGVKVEIKFPEGYEIEEGDIIEVFVKNKNDGEYAVEPNFSLTHGDNEGKIDLNESTILDILGLAPNTDYDSKVVFWSKGGLGPKYENQLDFSTDSINGITDVVLGDVLDHVAKFGIKLDPENVFLSSGDSCKIFVKKKGETKYPVDPNGESRGDILNENRFITTYFDDLNETYDVKAVLNVSGISFEKEVEFKSQIDDFNAELKEINPMTVQIEWRYPKNYSLVDGESVKVYTRFKEDQFFPEDPDIELIQSSEKDISNINLVELYSLIPETEYEIKVELNLLETEVEPIIKSFKTKGFEVQDLKIRDVNSTGIAVEWKLSENLGFIDEYDNLSIFVKESKDEDYDYDKPVAEFTKGLGDIRSAAFKINNNGEDLDIMVSYLIDNYESYGEITFRPLKVNVDVNEEDVNVKWAYPGDIEFKYGDRLDIYIKHSSSSGYKDTPQFRYTNGEDGDLIDLNEISLEGLEEGEYKLKFSLITSNMLYSPIELEFNVGGAIAGINGIPLKVNKILDSRSISFKYEGDISINYEEGYSIDPEGLEIYIDEDESIIITKIVPGKEYKKILLSMVDENGEEVTFVANDILTEPATLLEGFITNIYKFAFERYPDESGYDYWLNKLLEKKEVTGKFVLYNLMFAEREFSDRNLPDDELIKVLYQIVVNREYDEGGLNFWIGEYNNTYLPQANNDSYEAQKAIVTRMLYEQEFRNLCEKMGILW